MTGRQFNYIMKYKIKPIHIIIIAIGLIGLITFGIVKNSSPEQTYGAGELWYPSSGMLKPVVSSWGISGIRASISDDITTTNLTVSGTCIGCGGVASNSIDFDEIVDSATLDTNWIIGGDYYIQMTHASISDDLTIGDDIALGDDQDLYFDTAKTQNLRWSTAHGTLYFGGVDWAVPGAFTFYGNTGTDGGGEWSNELGLDAGGGVTIVGTGVSGVRIRTGPMYYANLLTSDLTATGIFEFPNISGTFLLATGSQDFITSGAITGTHASISDDLTIGSNITFSDTIASISSDLIIGGKIGIGTIEPSQLLHIVGNTDGSAIGPLLVSADASGTIGTALTLDDTAAGGRAYSFISTGPGASGGGGDFAVYTSTGGYAFRVNNVGQYIAGRNYYTYLGQITAKPYAASIKGIVIQGAISQTANLFEWQDSNANILGAINATGNVGIADTSPAYTLSVDGTASVSGAFYLPNSPSCDTLDTDANGLVSCGTDDTGSGAFVPHNLLSYWQSDTLAASVSEGSLIIGNSTPAWSELDIGASQSFLMSNGTTAGWYDYVDKDTTYTISGDPFLLSGTTLDIQYASAGGDGYLLSSDWSDFSGHLTSTSEHIDWTADQGATNINAGNYTDTNTTYTATAPLQLNGTAFAMDVASTSGSGYLSNTDWDTFNGKQATITDGTNLTFASTTLNVDDPFSVTTFTGTYASISELTIGTDDISFIGGVASISSTLWVGGTLTGAGTITATILTDGTAQLTGGNWTGIGSLTATSGFFTHASVSDDFTIEGVPVIATRSFEILIGSDQISSASWAVEKQFTEPFTITKISCRAKSGTSFQVDLQECDANAANCTDIDAAITCAATTTYDDGTLTNPTLDALDRLVASTSEGDIVGAVETGVIDVWGHY